CPGSTTFLLRTPEADLNYAEAMAYIGKDAEARTMLDKFLKTRMSAYDIQDLTGNQLIDFIREERAREFLLEGHRWFDLRRYTVCEPYPWSKTITHEFLFYGNYDIAYIERYVLEKNDPAYTLPIPRAIRNFQLSLGNNMRPDRVANKYIPEEDDDEDDDW
ncbi:MAG: RagB/SusD family nutrient uptake outer membrane protein, partial [Muribaculaceae bacterium]|nr:RagB/SusD family nutrient uptake outer membrane protein [Muribaculaceae bacterium]